MAEPTTTRKTLRRDIARALQMDFFRRYADGEVSLTGTPTSSSLISSSLTQSDNHWKGGWAYLSSGTYADQERKITGFTASTDAVALEYALAGAPSAGDKLEIFEGWPAATIHNYINRAIERAGRLWTNTVVDSTLNIREDTLRYTISGLTITPFRLNKVWVEQPSNTTRATIDSVTVAGADLQIALDDITLTADQFNTYKISLYDGTGRGIGTVDDTTTTYLLVTAADFSVAPVAGDKILLWDENYQRQDWREIRYMRTDARDYPDTIYLEGIGSEWYGCRLHIQYQGLPPALTTDASTTIVPKEVIISRVLGYLHEEMVNNNKADAARHQQLAQYHHAMADDYTARFYQARPANTQFLQGNLGSSELMDPLGWHD